MSSHVIRSAKHETRPRIDFEHDDKVEHSASVIENLLRNFQLIFAGEYKCNNSFLMETTAIIFFFNFLFFITVEATYYAQILIVVSQISK